MSHSRQVSQSKSRFGLNLVIFRLQFTVSERYTFKALLRHRPNSHDVTSQGSVARTLLFSHVYRDAEEERITLLCSNG